MPDQYSRMVLFSEIRSRVPELSSGQIAAIAQLYDQAWRTHNNTDHVIKMLQLANVHCVTLNKMERKLLTCMILYHGAVYHLGKEFGWNEVESATLAATQLIEAGFDENFAGAVEKGILASINHLTPEIHSGLRQTVEYFIDIDLFSGFGISDTEFDVTNQKIAQEYGPLYTTDEFWRGRKVWARNFLKSHKRIYINQCFHVYERDTRRRLRELTNILLPRRKR